MIKDDFKKILNTLANLFQREGQADIYEIIKCCIPVFSYTTTEQYMNGSVDIYSLTLEIPVDAYSKYDEKNLRIIEEKINNKLSLIARKYPDESISNIIIVPALSDCIIENPYKVPNELLIETLEAQKNIMISVSTGGSQIQSVNAQYKKKFDLIDLALKERHIQNPNPYSDLWEWYGKWSSGDLPNYQSRREFIGKMFFPLLRELKQTSENSAHRVFSEPTGWARVDRSLAEIRVRLSQAQNEEQFQAIGLLSRETLISLAQMVFDPKTHKPTDGIDPSETDAKRMLEAYINHVLPSETNEAIRHHAKAALSLANDLTHRRTANFQQAALCAEATTSIVNIIAITSGQRNRNF